MVIMALHFENDKKCYTDTYKTNCKVLSEQSI